MHGAFDSRTIKSATLLASLAVVLTGCLSDKKADTAEDTSLNVNVTGSVGDGPVVGASMSIRRSDGEVLAEFESDTFADFDVTVRTLGRYYPLTVEARDGIDLVTNLAPEFTLFGTIREPATSVVANVNPFSTFAVELAKDLPGGFTKENIDAAEDIVTDWFNSGLTSLVASGPISTRISEANIAEIVKASEALSETVRRTRNILQTFGATTTANQVIRSLGSDLIDEIVDGLGGPRTDARTAAIATIVSTQILLEAMANEIHVNGSDATGAMNAALDTVNGSTPAVIIDDQTATDAMLTLTRIGLAAAFAVSDSPKIAELQTAVSGLRAGMDPMLVRSLLPDDYRETLDNIIMAIGGGDISVVNTINNVARNGGEEPPPNRAPMISGVPGTTVAAGTNYLFTPTATDADGDALEFAISNMPAWASFNTSTGALSGIPISSDVGTYSGIVITATDGLETASLAPFAITVTMGNSAPQISGTPATAAVANSPYSFTPAASDADGDSLNFSITRRPSWLTFNTSTGALSGTPAMGDVGSYTGIVISVTDGLASASLPAFSISVTATNSAPTISGSPPASVNADTPYSFTPTANDVDGDNLTFSVSGLPAWASFSTAIGSITGTPTDANVGTYSDIRITVSDGMASDTLGPFTITVNAVSPGSVTLSWTPPTENEDGTPLTDLAGYRFYWGTTPGSYTDSVTVDNAGLTTYVVEDLAAGVTYEFVATSFNTSGVESTYSNPTAKMAD